MNLTELLNSPLAFWEGLTSEGVPVEPETIDSTSVEILEGTKEMMQLMSGSPDPFGECYVRAHQVRTEAGPVGLGRLRGAFLSENEAWTR